MRLATLAFALLLALPATGQTRYEWVGGSSGDWDVAANWSPAGVPAAADTAVIDGPSIRLAVMTEHTTVAGLEVTGLGAVGGNVDLTVTDRMVWSGGGAGFDTVQGTGALTVASGATLHMADGTTRFAMADGRTLVNDGTIVWDGSGTWSGQGKLVNNGEMVLAMGDTGSFGFIFSSFEDAITNTPSGVIRRDGPGTAEWYSGAVNEGVIRVESGVLRLRGFNSNGVRGTGTVEVADGARLDVAGGVHIVDHVTGSLVDVVQASSGQLWVSGDYDVTTTRLSGFGVLRLDGTSTTETLEMDDGRIEGEGTLTVTGSVAWTDGTMEGTGMTVLGPSVPLDISGTELRLSGSRTLRLEGPTTWSGEAGINAGSSTTTIVNAGTMTSSGPGERRTSFVTFQNEGTIIHDGGTLHIDSRMDNPGTVRVEDGTFKLGFNASGTDSGRYEIGDTGRLDIAVQSRTFAESAEFVGTGTVVFTSGAAVNQATWRPGASPGTLTIDSIWPAPAPQSALDIEIGGTGAGTDFDQVVVNGEAALGGTLRVTLLEGFTPAEGDRFAIIAASAGASGTFDAVELPDGLEAFVDVTAAGADLVIGTPVSNGTETPTALALAVAPNPAAGPVVLGVALPKAGAVRVAVYDALGREVAVALDRELPAGAHDARLDTARLAPGVYVVRLQTEAEALTRTLTMVR